MSELKPCPFCGGEAILESNKLRYGTIYSAYCQKCGAEITGFSEHEAVAAWNRRAQPANEPLTHCRDCTKAEPFQGNYICSEYGGIWGENDGCTHGERQPERSENDGQ